MFRLVLIIIYTGPPQKSAIQGVQVKYDEPYWLYGEDYFAPGNEEVCRLRRSC